MFEHYDSDLAVLERYEQDKIARPAQYFPIDMPHSERPGDWSVEDGESQQEREYQEWLDLGGEG